MLKLSIGDVTVTAVVEQQLIVRCALFFPGSTQEELDAIDWLRPSYLDDKGRLDLWVQALVVETPTRRIVVDTCMGNDKDRPSGVGHRLTTDFLEKFEAAGFRRDSVDTVLCTHLHVDHVGWNTMRVGGNWVPTFPRARYLFHRAEVEFWRDQKDGDDEQIFADSVQPIFDAGLAELVETDHRVCDEIRLVPTPGHTPGHVSVAIESRGEKAVITGDFIHHPAQIARPEWGSFVDVDRERGIATRRKFFQEVAGEPVLVIGTHFAPPTAGHIVRDGAAYRLKA